MMAQGLDLAPSAQKEHKTRAMGSRRIFPPHFKLQVLDSYRHDRDCKGNQRATARKFNIHRRQIQKWLQCEANLRSVVAESMRQDCSTQSRVGEPTLPHERDGPRVYKNDVRTLKLVAQRLYPSSFSGPMLKDGEVRKIRSEYYVPNQLNDIECEPTVGEAVAPHKLTISEPARGLYLKDDVSGPKLCHESNSLIQKYTENCGRELCMEPSGLGAPGIPSPPIGGMFGPPHHPPMYAPPLRLPRPVCPLPRPLPVHAAVSPSLPSSDEPYNLVKSPARPTESSTVPISREASPVSIVMSPLPARVAEITSENKTSAFSPKRKWLQDSLHDKLVSESQSEFTKSSNILPEHKAKKPCPDFSIERLCGSSTPPIKSEACTPPAQSLSPPVYPAYPPTSLVFPPPLLLPNRTIPNLVSLHFKPELPCENSQDLTVKEESVSDDEEQIDVLSTSPIENKTFDFPGGKRRSFSVQFKLNVLDAFYHDKDCNKNQRATARKFNINRRQVQKWLSLEPELRCEGVRKKDDSCTQCPQHCAVSVKPCVERNCFLSGLKDDKAVYPWSQPSAFSYVSWYNYDCNIY